MKIFMVHRGHTQTLTEKKFQKMSTINVYKFGKRCKIADFEKVMLLRNGTGATALAARATCGARWRHGQRPRAANFMNQTFTNFVYELLDRVLFYVPCMREE